MMLSVEQALELVLTQAAPLPAATVPLAAALGSTLAEEVASDVDSPPHDKSIVDGYAVVAADLAEGQAELEILEEIVAGEVPRRFVSRGQTTRIMTGAPIPAGADAVVMIERSELLADATRVRLHDPKISPGQNIVRQGVAMRRGDTVLTAGAVIRPAEIGLLAEVGRADVQVVPRPKLAVLSTGNELVPASQVPTAGRIRNSNGPMLLALAAQSGAVGSDLGIGRDERDELQRLITLGLQADVLVLSGGVSAGVLDLVPGVLQELGVQQVFHKLRLKPGKPLWFGVLPSPSPTPAKLVFGLPGNPVSSLVCFELFVRPALARLAGQRLPERNSTARLSREFSHRGDRPTYHPAVLHTSHDSSTIEPLPWQGSADLRTLAAANALALFPSGDRIFAAGDVIDVLTL